MNTRYRHYKGGLYELVCEATLESDLTPLIIYRAADGSICIYPKEQGKGRDLVAAEPQVEEQDI